MSRVCVWSLRFGELCLAITKIVTSQLPEQRANPTRNCSAVADGRAHKMFPPASHALDMFALQAAHCPRTEPAGSGSPSGSRRRGIFSMVCSHMACSAG